MADDLKSVHANQIHGSRTPELPCSYWMFLLKRGLSCVELRLSVMTDCSLSLSITVDAIKLLPNKVSNPLIVWSIQLNRDEKWLESSREA